MNVLDQYITPRAALYHGDSVPVFSALPANSAHLSVHSPPFSGLYIYSDSEADMGNCADDTEFFQQYAYLIRELYRVTVPGRLAAVHCKQLVNYKGRDGAAGLRDFRGEIIRRYVEAGWTYHSEVCIWTDPVHEMQRTKAHGLLYKQIRADASFSRQGLPEYLLLFRKWARSEEDDALVEPVTHTHASFPLDLWQRYASPVWFDIKRTDVLNVQLARDDRDEKHICPLQLEVIERAITLWSNPGDVVIDPFAGVGSTGYQALTQGRRFVGAELKRSYYDQACRFLRDAEQAGQQLTLFDTLEPLETAVEVSA